MAKPAKPLTPWAARLGVVIPLACIVIVPLSLLVLVVLVSLVGREASAAPLFFFKKFLTQ